MREKEPTDTQNEPSHPPIPDRVAIVLADNSPDPLVLTFRLTDETNHVHSWDELEPLFLEAVQAFIDSPTGRARIRQVGYFLSSDIYEIPASHWAAHGLLLDPPIRTTFSFDTEGLHDAFRGTSPEAEE